VCSSDLRNRDSSGDEETAVPSVHTTTLDRQVGPTVEAIARRAYERFKSRGEAHGLDIEDWLAAEADLSVEPSRGFALADAPGAAPAVHGPGPIPGEREVNLPDASLVPNQNNRRVRARRRASSQP